MKKDMPLEGLRWSRDSGSALYDTPQTAVLGRAGGGKKEAGLNAFTLSPKKWIDTTNAIGLIAKSGRYGGTYAHKDIAFSLSEFISAACINE